MVEAARKRPEIMVQVGLEYRYMPPVAKLIETVKGGKLGPVRMVAIREHRFPFLVKVTAIQFSLMAIPVLVLDPFLLTVGEQLESIQC